MAIGIEDKIYNRLVGKLVLLRDENDVKIMLCEIANIVPQSVADDIEREAKEEAEELEMWRRWKKKRARSKH